MSNILRVITALQNHPEPPQNAIKRECSELLEIKNIPEIIKNLVQRLEDKIEGNLPESQVKRQRSRK